MTTRIASRQRHNLAVLLVALLGCVAAGLVAVASPVPAATESTLLDGLLGPNAHFDSIVTFGDSMSDNGNTWKLTNQTWPLAPFDHGRFSDGPVWVEHLAGMLPDAGQPALSLRNFAYGGATTSNAFIQGYSGPKEDVPVPSVQDQLATFAKERAQTGADKYGRTLYTVWAGGNDIYYFGKNSKILNPVKLAGSIMDAVTAIDALHAQDKPTNPACLGHHRILVMTVPPLSKVPAIRAQSPLIRAAITAQTALTNLDLGARIFAYNAGRVLRGQRATVTLVDVTPFMEALAASPASFGLPTPQPGFGGAEDPCVVITDPVAPKYTVCPDPQAHIFYDTFHLTSGVQAKLARVVVTALGKVDVPSTIANLKVETGN
ncbi:hypothetical protein GGF32_002204 [Allomyces javanicus]|nr:hypothetical protein GGF32_002204 [Allomyces javanicus]